MTLYYAFVDDFKKFMHYFRFLYPELYVKYKTYLAMPQKGMTRARITDDKIINPVARIILSHIINEYYTVRCN